MPITTKRWRIAVGGDIAGIGYKDMIRAKDLEADDRVAEVIDVGVNDDTANSTRYPSVAHEAAETVAAGRPTGPSSSAAPASARPSAPTRFRVSLRLSP